MAEATARRAHLNLVESSRLLFSLDRGAELQTRDGWLFGAGSPTHPMISNVAFRLDDGLEPAELLAHAGAFFGSRGRRFSVWARSGVPEDEELIAGAEADGFKNAYEMPEMVLHGRPDDPPLAEGVELRRLASIHQ